MNWLYFDSYNTTMRSESIWCSDTMTHEKISLIWTHIFRLPLFYCSSCWLLSHHHHQWEWIDRIFLYTSLSYISRIWHHKWKTRNGFIFQVTDYHLMICILLYYKLFYLWFCSRVQFLYFTAFLIHVLNERIHFHDNLE